MEDAIEAARIIEPAAARNLLDYAEFPLTTVKGAGPEIADEDIG